MKQLLQTLILLFFSFLFTHLYSDINVDLRTLPYSKIIAALTNNELNISNVRQVWISHPFPRNKGRLDLSSRYYVLTQQTNHWIRGNSDSGFGSFSEFTNLIKLFEEKNLQTGVWIDPFSKGKDFNRLLWSSHDFVPQSLSYENHPFLNIKDPKVRFKLKKDFTILNRLPVNWIVDLHTKPKLSPAWIQFLQKNISRFFLYGETVQPTANIHVLTTQNADTLRVHYFFPQSTNLSEIQSFDLSNSLHLIRSRSFSFSELATVFYLLAHHDTVVLPYSVWKNAFYRKLILSLDTTHAFQTRQIDSSTLLLKNPKQVVLIYTGKTTKRQIFSIDANLNGTFKSVYGNAYLVAKGSTWSFFILPESVYLWNIH